MTPVQKRPELLPDDTSVGAYSIAMLVRQGGMALVYLARDRDRRERVALKVMLHAYADDPECRARFALEAGLQARLRDCAHVAQLRDQGQLPDGRPYLVLEWVEGNDLDDLLEYQRNHDDTVHFAIATRYALGVARALATLHERGVVHRALKPGNIMIERSTDLPKLMDFGSAADVAAAPATTEDLTKVVSIDRYASPEQAQGQRPHPCMDIWSYGAVLLELYRPYNPRVPETLRTDALDRALRISGPRALQGRIRRLIEDCLAPDPTRRPEARTIVRYLEAVERALETPEVATGTDAPRPRAVAGELQTTTRMSLERPPRPPRAGDTLRGTVVVAPIGGPPPWGQVAVDDDAITTEEDAVVPHELGSPSYEEGDDDFARALDVAVPTRPLQVAGDEDAIDPTERAATQPVRQATASTPDASARPPEAADSASRVAVEGPASRVAVEGPASRVAVEGPASRVTVESPASRATVDGPTSRATVDGPTSRATVESPASRVAVESPASRATVEGPPSRATVEGPASRVGVEGPTGRSSADVTQLGAPVAHASARHTPAAAASVEAPRIPSRTGQTQPNRAPATFAGPIVTRPAERGPAKDGPSSDEPAIPPLLAWTGAAVLVFMMLIAAIRAWVEEDPPVVHHAGTVVTPGEGQEVAEVEATPVRAIPPVGLAAPRDIEALSVERESGATERSRAMETDEIADLSGASEPREAAAATVGVAAGTNDARRGTNDARGGTNDALAGTNDARAGTNDALAGSNEAPRGTNEARAAAHAHEAPAAAHEARAAAHEARAAANEAPAAANDAADRASMSVTESRKAPAVSREAPTDSSAACEAKRQRTEQAFASNDWSRVLVETKQRECWSTHSTGMLLRLEALIGLSRFDQCISEGAKSKDPQVKARVQTCRALKGER